MLTFAVYKGDKGRPPYLVHPAHWANSYIQSFENTDKQLQSAILKASNED